MNEDFEDPVKQKEVCVYNESVYQKHLRVPWLDRKYLPTEYFVNTQT